MNFLIPDKKTESDSDSMKVKDKYAPNDKNTFKRDDCIIPLIKSISAKEYFKSMDNTRGFYSEEELKNSDCIYGYSEDAKNFVENLNINRANRHHLIANIADVFLNYKPYGIVNTYTTFIKGNDNLRYKEISIASYDLICKCIFLYIADEYGYVLSDKVLALKKDPDAIFKNWNNYIIQNYYEYTCVRFSDVNLECKRYTSYIARYDFVTEEVSRNAEYANVILSNRPEHKCFEITHESFRINDVDPHKVNEYLTTIKQLKNEK